MYHLKPMPSPRGTNTEGLYLAVAGRPAVAAYDAMPAEMSRRDAVSPLEKALRRKYRTPHDVMRALGLDGKLLEDRRAKDEEGEGAARGLANILLAVKDAIGAATPATSLKRRCTGK